MQQPIHAKTNKTAVAERLANGCSEREAFLFWSKKAWGECMKEVGIKTNLDIAFNTGLD
jgi:hypothetical protein